MNKILFLIHDLHHGGAKKFLVNLVNNKKHYDIEIAHLEGSAARIIPAGRCPFTSAPNNPANKEAQQLWHLSM